MTTKLLHNRRQLLSFLDSDDNEYGLDSVATHGFLTATVVGKPLQNWISILFDEKDTEISDETKQEIVLWQSELQDQLRNEEPIELPFNTITVEGSDDYGDDYDDDSVDFSADSELSAWAVGFVDAMYSETADDWFDDEDAEDDVAMLTLPMIVFSGIDEEDETLQDIRSDEDMLVQMANTLESNLTELFLLFHIED